MVLRGLLELVGYQELLVQLGLLALLEQLEQQELLVLLEQKPPTIRLLRIRLIRHIMQIRIT